MGSQVLTATDPCVSIPCRNGASCISRGAESYYCICRNGYRGNNCDDAIGKERSKDTYSHQSLAICCTYRNLDAKVKTFSLYMKQLHLMVFVIF